MSRQNLLTVIFIVALGLAGYFWYTYSQSQPVVSEGNGGMQTMDLGDYAKVESLAPDLTLFANPLFKALTPLPVPLRATTTPGRANPFVPF
ncbi:hypothetical protein KGQ34_01220 [Patescibacteria group bacterium]|nr:hypothetical protein [Patescibacteria group bacterium]